MTLYEFRALDEMEQQEAIWDGVFIAVCYVLSTWSPELSLIDFSTGK